MLDTSEIVIVKLTHFLYLKYEEKFIFTKNSSSLDQIKMNDDVKIEDSAEKDLNSEDNIAIKSSDVKLSDDTIIDSAEVKQDDSSIFKELYDQGRDS